MNRFLSALERVESTPPGDVAVKALQSLDRRGTGRYNERSASERLLYEEETVVLEDYLTTRELAELWGLTQREVRRKAKEGRYDGAVKVANRWLVPVGLAWLKIRDDLGFGSSVPWQVVRDAVTLSCEVGR